MAQKQAKSTGGGRWIQELRTEDTVEEKEGTFSENNSAEEIAIELKRKAPDFQSAMAKVTLYINRAGKRLSKSRVKELNRVKSLLRTMYNRKDRQKANKKKANQDKIAAVGMLYKDKSGKEHLVDMFLENLEPGKDKSMSQPHVSPSEIKKYKKWLLDLFKQEIPYPEPHDLNEEKADFDVIKKKMIQRWRENKNIPGFEIEMGTAKPLGPQIVPKVACSMANVNGTEELIFASNDNAIQYLANFIGKRIKIGQ